MSGIFTAIAGILPTSGGATPSKLFDSINATGEAEWNFDTGNSTEKYAGQQNVVISVNSTFYHIDVPITGHFWTGIGGSMLKVYVYQASGNDWGSLIGASDAVAGDSSWAHTTVPFTFSTPLVVSAQTIQIALGFSVDPSNPSSTGAWYTTPTVASGQLTLFSNAGVSKYPTTFPNYDLQLQIWGTTP